MIKSKLPAAGTSIFSVMTRMALKYNAINLSQGFPDFNCSEELLALAAKYQYKGFNQYAPMEGVPELREKLSQKIKKIYNKFYDPESEITITSGATQAIFTAITATVQNGDEVILLEPVYDSYAPSVIVNGGKPVFVPLKKSDYRVDWERVKHNITDKTKLLIINSPHNPTGSVINEADIKNLEEIAENNDIFLISDEVYEHIVFDEAVHLSLSSSEVLAQKSFVISSFGKTYHTTGWKTGYCAAPEILMDEFRKIHQFAVFAVNTPLQYAYAEFLNNEDHYLKLKDFYQKKRNLVTNLLSDSKFRFRPAGGTYFQLLDYSDISGIPDMKFAEYITKEHKVAVIPLSPFYSNQYNEKTIRICFAKKDEVLIEAIDRLKNVVHTDKIA